jgi:outer membrane protein TolC
MRSTVALLALMLAACAGEPPRRPEAPALPASWPNPSHPQDAAQGSAGWAPLLDPQLSALQVQALRANTDIRRAALAWQQAQLQAQSQGLRLQPSAGLSYNANRPLESQGSSIVVDGVRVPVGNTATWSHSYGASVGVAFEADLWNRLAQLEAQQQALSEAARSDVDAARLLIAGNVAQAYWTLAANRRFEQLARRKLELSEQLLPLVRLRVREGKLLPLEIDKAALAVQSARQGLAEAVAAADKQRLALAQLLDQPPPGPVLDTAQLPDKPLPAWLPDEPAQVLERRPDVKRARLEVDAALAGARATRAARYPQLSFNAGITTGGQRLSDWLAQPLLALGSSLAIPLIDWRRLDLADATSRSQLDSAALGLRARVYKALSEVQSGVIDARSLEAQSEAARQTLAEDLEAERQAQLKLEVGSIARSDEIQARIARVDAERGLVQLQLAVALNRLQLLQALAVPLPEPSTLAQ